MPSKKIKKKVSNLTIFLYLGESPVKQGQTLHRSEVIAKLGKEQTDECEIFSE